MTKHTDTQADGCPIDLRRDGSPEHRLGYFNSSELLVSHPALERNVEKLVWASKAVGDQNVTLFLGPTGVGKTACMKLAVRRLNAEAQSGSDRYRVAALCVEAEAAEDGRIDYKHLYASILTKFNAVSMHRSLPLVERQAGSKAIVTVDPQPFAWLSRPTDLRCRVQNEISARGTQLLAIDEAAFLLIATAPSAPERRRRMTKNSAIIRSLVNKTRTRLLLAGAYEILDLMSHTGQLARRVDLIAFLEYLETDTDGLYEFSVGWIALVRHLPIDSDLGDSQFAVEIFYQCIGCIGVAKLILARALLDALRTNVKMTRTLVRQHYYAAPLLRQMKSEALDGRAALAALMSVTQRVDLNKAPLEQVDIDEPMTRGVTKPVAARRSVGQMNPRRDFQDCSGDHA